MDVVDVFSDVCESTRISVANAHSFIVTRQKHILVDSQTLLNNQYQYSFGCMVTLCYNVVKKWDYFFILI